MIYENKNIKLGYWLTALNNAFFWYAPWLLFVYQYIDIKQVATLQLIGMTTRIISEVPTGVICDLLGKKKTLILAFLLTAIGETSMAFSSNFVSFCIVYVIINLGYSFYSGTMDAFTYDSLVESGKQDEYPKVLSKSNIYLNIATAIATISGGFLFQFWGGLPFLITGLAKFVGLALALFVSEPKVDTYKFSLKNSIEITKKGFSQLFSKKMLRYTGLLLIVGVFSTVGYEILDDAAVVDWGYSATGISILYTSFILLSIPSGILYDKIAKKIKPETLIVLAIILLGINYLFSRWINVYIWTGLFLLRVIYSPIKRSVIADLINQHTISSVRATTLSVYELIIKLPFVLLGIPIGTMLQTLGIKNFSLTFSVVLLTTLGVFIIFNKVTATSRQVTID